MNKFKHDILNNKNPLGTWMMTGSDTVAEAMACTGFDFLVLDQEHVPVSDQSSIQIDRAVKSVGRGTEILYRLAWNNNVLLKKALDGGALNIMVPFIQNAEEARQAVADAYYPPLGRRGFAAVHRASLYGTNTHFVQEAKDELCLILQLETPEAIDNIEEIAKVQGVTGLFIGPGDMSCVMGHIGNPSHPVIQAKIKEGLEKCQALNKPCGIVGGNPDLVNQYRAMGFSFVALGSDMSMMMARAKEMLSAVKGDNIKVAGGEVY